MPFLLDLFQTSESPEAYVEGYCRRVSELMETLDRSAIARVMALLERTAHDDKVLFLIANGGSAGVGAHMVNDLGPNSMVADKPGLRVFNLADNAESITSVANDMSFEDIFAQQLEAYLRPGDLVLAMSVSGNSENIVRGVEVARRQGGTVVGFTGFDGGRLAGLCDVHVHMETTPDEYGPVEDIFGVLGHMVASYFTMARGRALNH